MGPAANSDLGLQLWVDFLECIDSPVQIVVVFFVDLQCVSRAADLCKGEEHMGT